VCVCIPNGQKRARKKEVEETKGKSTNEPKKKKGMEKRKGKMTSLP
jgi:hypothetical protein